MLQKMGSYPVHYTKETEPWYQKLINIALQQERKKNYRPSSFRNIGLKRNTRKDCNMIIIIKIKTTAYPYTDLSMRQ